MAGQRVIVETNSPEETRDLGRRLGEQCRGGEMLALIGELGSGKTQFCKGLAAGLGVGRPEHLTSPTFVIINEYPGRLTFYHIDAYRLGGPADMEALGVDDLAASGGVMAIEWADRVGEWIPREALEIRFDLTGPDARRLTLAWHDTAAEALAKATAGRATD